MAGQENVYNLGVEGVNVVASPIHLKNGELVQAQNAAFNPNSAEGGIGMRGGLSRLNASAMTGSILGVVNVPLPAPGQFTRTFKAALMTLDSDTWANSTNGTSYTESASPARAANVTKYTFSNYLNQRVLTFNRKLYYQADGYTQYPTAGHTGPPIRAFDGSLDVEVLKIPFNPSAGSATSCLAILDWCIHDGEIYLSVHDPGGAAPDHRGRVFKFTPETGTLEQIGNRFGAGSGEAVGGMPYCLASWNGLLWVGTYGISGGAVGRIYSIRPGVDTSWTLRVTTAAGAGYIMTMAPYRGDLHFGTQGDAGTAALWRKLGTDLTTLTTIDTGSATDAFNYFGGMIVYDGSLYAVYMNLSPAVGKTTHIRKWDGSAITTDRDVDANEGAREVGQPFVYNSALYVPFQATGSTAADGFILRKASGAYTAVLSNANLRGYFGRVDVAP